MTDISPEDRERLAKTKFGEWFDEFWDKKFKESFEGAVAEFRTSQHPSGQGQQGQGQGQGQQSHEPVPMRRRSLLEECFSQTFGIGR